eukprot:m.50622 g.50622  ORF g.50622 m.50622 type:complete len:609 (-) comp11603_c2_seq2:27-1853(-)
MAAFSSDDDDQAAALRQDEIFASSNEESRRDGVTYGVRDAPRPEEPQQPVPWGAAALPINMPPFTNQAGPVAPHAGEGDKAIIDLFFTDEIMEQLLVQSNKRANIRLSQKSSRGPKSLQGWMPMSRGELYGYLAIIVYMGVLPRPAEADYWSSDPLLGSAFVASIMSYKRFKHIKHVFSAANPLPLQEAQSKLAKIDPFPSMVLGVCQQRFLPAQELTLQECFVSTNQRFGRVFSQASPGHMLAEHCRILTLRDSRTGYCVSYHVDCREQTTRDLVLATCSSLPHQPFRIAADPTLASIPTALALLTGGLYMYGAVAPPVPVPGAGPDDLPASLQKEPLADGDYRWCMGPPHLSLTVWRDMDPAGEWYLSTFHTPDPAVTVQRRVREQYERVSKPAPRVAADYHASMRICDQVAALQAAYSVQLNHRHRWYTALVYFCLDVLLTNAHIYERTVKGPGASTKDFRLAVAHLFASRAAAVASAAMPSAAAAAAVLAPGPHPHPHPHVHVNPHVPAVTVITVPTAGEDGAEPGSPPKTPAPPRKRTKIDELPPERLVGSGHVLEKCNYKRQCSWCYKQIQRQKKVYTRCAQCKVHLHSIDCFFLYHAPPIN